MNQTVLDLLDEDVEVHVVADAVGSRTEANRELGLAKMERGGALVTSVEMALFELLARLRRPRVQASPGARRANDRETTRATSCSRTAPASRAISAAIRRR